jgi:hypothetical protein
MMRTLLAIFLIGSAATPGARAGDELNAYLIGDWRLVAAIPGNMQDSSPNGVRNLRLRFATDGIATIVDPLEILSQSTTRNRYELDGNTLTLQVGEGQEVHGAVEELPGDGASVTFLETGMAWSLRRITDKSIETKRLPAESVQYMPPATLATIDAFRYDDVDYSKLPLAERLLGQWEVVEISGYGGGDFPPYGAPNDVWQFQGKQIRHYGRSKPDEAPGFMEYEVRGPFLMMGGAEGGEPTPFRFNVFQQLVIGDADSQHTVLKRINRDSKGKVTLPPLRIILGYPAGAE